MKIQVPNTNEDAAKLLHVVTKINNPMLKILRLFTITTE